MQSASFHAVSRDAIISERPATLLAHVELVTLSSTPQDSDTGTAGKSSLDCSSLSLTTESLTAKYESRQIWVGWSVPVGVEDLKGRVPRMFRGTEEMHKPLYSCSSGQQGPRGEAVYTTQHL